jgi:hypothetical protein
MIKLTQLLKEAHEHDRDMVVGVAEILRMVDDIDNRDDIADEMMDKFDREGVDYDVDEFLQMCGLSSLEEAAPMLNKPKVSKAPKGVKKQPLPQSEKPTDVTDKIKNAQTRLSIIRKQLTLPHTSDAKTKLQKRIIKTQDTIKNLNAKKG